MEPHRPVVTRRLAAILAADAANFSRLVGQDEERTLQILSGHRTVIDDAIGLHGGRIVTTAGDSLMAEFSSPVQAVRAAIEIQRSLHTLNAEAGLGMPMLFRIGINVGDVVVEGENIMGDEVNIAARLEALAPPGGIYVSAGVRDHVAGKLSARFQDLGSQILKNISRPVRVYQVIPELGGRESVLARARRSSPSVLAGASTGIGALVVLAGWYLFQMNPPGPEEAISALPAVNAERLTEEHAFWDSVKQTSDPAELRAYLKKYPRGTFADLGRARLEGLLAARARHSAEQEAQMKANEAKLAQAEAVRLKSEAETAIARAAAEQATATRLKAEAELAAVRAAAAARLATESQKRLARSQERAAVPRPPDRITLAHTASSFDGRWSTDWTCEASADQPASSVRLPAQIRFHEITIETGQVGLPGHLRAHGNVAEDGSFQIIGTFLPRTQRIVGNEQTMKFRGRVEGERLEGDGTIGTRRCSLVLSRVAVQ